MNRRASPLVTGISPKEGPPGTRVTIRGENLGETEKDLIGLKICGVDCLLSAEWKSSSKVIARTGPGKGMGDVVVMTMSGGSGTCSVGFRGYFVQTGPLQESAIWVDESGTFSSTSLLRSQPSSPVIKIEDDPLGISDEGNQGKFPEESLLEYFPEGSGNIALGNFNPVWYLVENHHKTKFTDLKAGLSFLKMRVEQRSDGPLSFVKANVTTFLDCQAALEAMHKQLLEDELKDQGCYLTEKLELVLQQSNNCANSLFEEVLGRRDLADATRNALSVLNRFKFLFNLPCNIERNIKKGDYDLVINDYARAKSLFGGTEVQIFKKVYAEVEERITALREKLQCKLMQLPSTLEEQKKIIRYLSNLRVQGDPAWQCIVNQQKWLIGLLNSCKDDHLNPDKDNTVFTDYPMSPKMSISTPRGSYSSGMRHYSVSGLNMTQSPDISMVLSSPGPAGVAGMQVRSPQKVQFVEDLTAILSDTLPDLWKLGHAYFGGQLVVRDAGEAPGSPDASKHVIFKGMLLEVISLFCNLLRSAFLPETINALTADMREGLGAWPEGDIPGAWLPHCVRYVRSCVISVGSVELHGDCVELLTDLAFDMRVHCLKTLLKQAVDDVQSLHTRETWALEVSDEYGGTTQLPLLFENVVTETIQHLHEVVMTIKEGELEIFTPRPVQKEATGLCTKLLQAFAKCLHDLAIHGTGEKLTPMMALASKMGGKAGETDDVPALDRRLIIMLSNCANTIERVIPRLIENLDKHGYPEMNRVHEECRESYCDLDETLFTAYIEEKTNPIIGQMEINMYMGRFDWKNTPKPTGVRTYMKTVVTGMVAVHAEVFSISSAFVPRVLHHVVQAVADELLRLFQCVAVFSNYGALQARLDLNSLMEAVDLYLTDESRATFNEALDCVQQITISDDKKLFLELRNQFRSRMKFHLLSLREAPLPDSDC